MQKIQSYLYPNRVILLADLAGFTVENTIVYQRTTKIYRGVDNVLEFDIQNADQKRLDLLTTPSITNIHMNVMDAGGKALPHSPYTVTATSTKGIASVTIPSADLAGLNTQFLKYSVTARPTVQFVVRSTLTRIEGQHRRSTDEGQCWWKRLHFVAKSQFSWAKKNASS